MRTPRAPGVIPTSSASPTPANALLLSPWWQLPEELKKVLEQADTRGATPLPVLSDRDRGVLRTAARMIKRARLDLDSRDPAEVASARRSLLSIFAYLSGFGDGKRLAGAYAGLASAAGVHPGNVDFEKFLIDIESSLLSASSATRTGALLPLGVMFVAAGVACKLIADNLQ